MCGSKFAFCCSCPVMTSHNGRKELSMDRKHYYTDDKNAQIVIALLKAYGNWRVVANPKSANISFVGSVQIDPSFEKVLAVR